MNIEVNVHLAGLDAVDKALATIDSFNQLGEQIMSAITEYAARAKEHNDRVAKALDGLAADIAKLNDSIASIQNSPGSLSAEDQAALDSAEAAAKSLAEKAEGLDGLTPPEAPPVG